MLIQFNFKNHKSFYEKSTLDMTVTAEKRHINDAIEINGNKMLPFLAIYGANASGKSTVIDAFFYMAKAVARSFDSDLFEPFLVVPFAFNEKLKQEPSEFEIFLNIGDYEYRYGFIATKDLILEEWLYKKLFKAKTKAKEKMLFERQKGAVVFGQELKKEEQVEELITDKTLLLSILGRRKTYVAKDIYNWFINNNLVSEQPYISETVIKLLHEDKNLYSQFKTLLSEIDPCLKDLKITPKEDENQRTKYEVQGVHSDAEDSNKTHLLPLRGESSGTKRIIKILPIILKTLIEGSLLFVDELDTQLHPLLLKKIVYMFSDKDINKHNAQLVYTTHNTFMFNSQDMRRDQILLVEKDKYGKSKLYSLSDFKKLRSDSDYEKKYLSGEFGSIPFINQW